MAVPAGSSDGSSTSRAAQNPQASSPGPPSPRQTFPHQPASTPKRIDNILETTRTRSVASGNTHPPISMSRSPILRESLALSDAPDNHLAEFESSGDERTAIVRDGRPQPQSYQSTDDSGIRARNSNASSRRPGQERASGARLVEDAANDESWWKRLLARYGSIELENKASVARDHLALERTYLAWLRTSLAFASIGIAITQLFRLNTATAGSENAGSYKKLRQMGKPLGATFLGISIIVLFLGFHRYFESQQWIIKGKFPASRGSIALVSLVAFALMVTSLAVVLIVEPSSYEA
ncbi:MAG: hypothetical protein M1818_007276 [Claussenomyces sp. TS43310]|nr:MAG: hypothetical protein M1818_007276 [Claussenomyces sp. TS43310]